MAFIELFLGISMDLSAFEQLPAAFYTLLSFSLYKLARESIVYAAHLNYSKN